MQYLNISSSLEDKYRKAYISDHSKFIHSSWLLKEDLGKVSVIDDVSWTIIGLWDLIGFRRQILLRSDRGFYAIEDSKIVSQGMGIRNMRNFVTGEEHEDWIFQGNTGSLDSVDLKDEEILQDDDGKVLDTHEDHLSEEDLDFDDQTDYKTPQDDEEVWGTHEDHSSEEDPDFNSQPDEDDIDPLVKALQKEISDDDDF